MFSKQSSEMCCVVVDSNPSSHWHSEPNIHSNRIENKYLSDFGVMSHRSHRWTWDFSQQFRWVSTMNAILNSEATPTTTTTPTKYPRSVHWTRWILFSPKRSHLFSHKKASISIPSTTLDCTFHNEMQFFVLLEISPGKCEYWFTTAIRFVCRLIEN